MEIYCVGGAVRDELLGLPVKDRDYVVVGASPEEMSRAGFKPVGKDFPVFLHPKTHEQYALARTERKTARGYKGFQVVAAPEVTLEQDLARRDLTINAIARDGNGRIIDPHGGAADLARGLLRHVSPAFAEDPVRILRVARFAARFGFRIAPATQRLMRAMVAGGEADALVAERVWQELAKGLMEMKPSKMFAVLRGCGALARLLPELDAAWAEPSRYGAARRALDFAAGRGCALEERYAVMVGALENDGQLLSINKRLRAPADCAELALLALRYRETLAAGVAEGAPAVVALLQRCDAWRKPARFGQLLQVMQCTSSSRARAARAARLLLGAMHAARAVDAGAIASRAVEPRKIAAALKEARVKAVESVL